MFWTLFHQMFLKHITVLGAESVSIIQRDLSLMELEFTHVFHHLVLLLEITFWKLSAPVMR